MDKTNKTLTIVIFILIGMLMATWMIFGHKIDQYKELINSIDTTSVVIKHDTIDVSTDTTIYKPVIIKETIIRVDTLYNDDGDAINVKKKKRHIQIPSSKIQIQ